METVMTVCGKEYEILLLLGHGKGGYSYLAQADGKQIGRATGATVTTKKSKAAKELIRKYSRDFDGTLNDIEVLKMIGNISRNSYYKYKAELRAEQL